MKILLLILAGLFGSLAGKSQVSEVDPRVSLHYSPEEISMMESQYPQKLRMVNFYYSQSFIVEQNPRCPHCTPLDAATVDIANYEGYRKVNERVKVSADNKGGHFIILLSRKELLQAYSKL